MARFAAAAQQDAQNILEGIPLTELATIARSNVRELSSIERRAQAVKKNKIFNVKTLQRSRDPYSVDKLVTKLSFAKLMKFISAELKKFHPYLVQSSMKMQS